MQLKTILVDIGNSSTELAECVASQITPLASLRTAELAAFLTQQNYAPDTQFVISSVVPKQDALFADFPNTRFITYQNIPMLKINLSEPQNIGADRLVNALAAYQKVQGSCLVIDSGTATTICYVDATGTYQGGIILPGFEISSKALHDYTAKIPLIWVEPITNLYGKNTSEAVQIGLFKGAIHQLNGFIAEYKKMDPQITVIGTGTALNMLQDFVHLDHFEPNLILQGLALICAKP
jgi:pantothenate kinase type III